MGSYVFRWAYPAKDVHVTGTFDDWAKSIQMEKLDHELWEKEVELPSADEKVYFKFVVDGEWIVDENLPKEGDGHYNINNVVYPHQIKRKPAVSASATGDVPGAFPDTPSTEPAAFGVQPIPASSGIANPITVPAGESLPSQKDISSNTVGSTVTTSEEDYKKAGSTAVPDSSSKDAAEYSVNPLPATAGIGNPVSVPAGEPVPSQKDLTTSAIGSTVTTSQEDYEKAGSSTVVPGSQPEESNFSVAPIPASSGIGNPVSVPAGEGLPEQKDLTSDAIGSAVTTSKEDYDKVGSSAAAPDAKAEESNFSVNPIPASEGIGNPVSVAPGESLPQQKEVTPHTIESTVTTSKDDYENAGSSGFPAYAAAGAGAAAAAGGLLGGAALGNALSAPKEKENLIPESSLPMGADLKDTKDSGPFISSAAPTSTATDLAAKVPLETAPTSTSSGPETTTVAPATNVAAGSDPFMRSSGPDATTSKLASELEVPLKSTTPFIASSGPGTTTADLAAKAPLESDPTTRSSGLETTTAAPASSSLAENDKIIEPTIQSSGPDTTTADLAAKVPVEDDPTIRSSGPDTTTAALAASVPLTAAAAATTSGLPEGAKDSALGSADQPDKEVVQEKADLEKELLSKVPTSEATGEPSSAAADQTSYYGLATSVPPTVEKSMEKAQAAPEAAAETSAVAEKSAVEEELLRKVPSTDAAGEPAPAFSVANYTVAPTATSTTPAADVANVTDGKTANEPVPDTDTSSAARGPSAGELAGGAVVGGAAAAGAATLAAQHKDADHEPPRVADSQKPDITTEASPADVSRDQPPGQSKYAAAAVADGADGKASLTEIPKSTAPVETTEAATTEYAPVRTGPAVPGVSSTAAAALSDGTEDPTLMETPLEEPVRGLADEPAVKMMNQNEGAAAPSALGATAATTAGTSATTTTVHDTTTTAAETSSAAPVADTTPATGTVHDITTSDTPAAAATATTAPNAVSAVDTTTATDTVHDKTTSATLPTTAAAPPTTTAATEGTASAPSNQDPSSIVAAAGVPTLTSAGTETSKVHETKEIAPPTSSASAAEPKAPSTPAKKTTGGSGVQSPATSTATSTATEKKKKRHRLSRIYHKIFD